MSKPYLYFDRESDMSEVAKLNLAIDQARSRVFREMHHARTWRGRPDGAFQQKAIRNHVQRAREANAELVDLLRMKRKATP